MIDLHGVSISLMNINQSIGYSNKIVGEIEGFNALGINMDLICLGSGNSVVLKRYYSRGKNPKEKVLTRYINFPFLNRINLYNSVLNHIAKTSVNFLYIRFVLSDALLLLFLYKVKKTFPQIVTILEIPTFPYDQINKQIRNYNRRILVLFDKITRKYLNNFVDRVAVVDYEYPVFGIPSITIHNGVRVSGVNPIKKTKRLNDEFHLVGVVNLNYYSAYDRVLYGLKQYYQSNTKGPKVFFHVVCAPSLILNDLKRITSVLSIYNYVIFHGQKFGRDLDELFEKCHIAVGNLGWHRVWIKQASALKSREYAARGIPFIFSGKDLGFSSSYPYALEIVSDDTPVDIKQIMSFAINVYKEPDHAKKIREYASVNLNWTVQMKKVVSELKTILEFPR